MAEARNDADRQKWRTIVQLYRDAGADYDVRTAIWLGDLNQVKARFDRTAVRTDGFYEENPLRLAASLGQTDICRYLIEEHHVDVNAFDQGNGYPIIKDALAFLDVVRLLIENVCRSANANYSGQGSTGTWINGDDATALHYAAEDGVPETLTLLIDSGVDVFLRCRVRSVKKSERNRHSMWQHIWGKLAMLGQS
ncbi:MAG: ankyrin repeat domain-containing protein [Planctomycetaceae bacterium]